MIFLGICRRVLTTFDFERITFGLAFEETLAHLRPINGSRIGLSHQKSDLRIRPIWHQKEDRVLAHILICFLAYVLWKTLAQMSLAAGLGAEPRRLFAELGELRMMDIVLPLQKVLNYAATA